MTWEQREIKKETGDIGKMRAMNIGGDEGEKRDARDEREKRDENQGTDKRGERHEK